MDAKQVIEILKEQIANAKARWIESVTLANLEAVVNEIGALAESSGVELSAADLEHYKAQNASDLAGYQVQSQFALELVRSIIVSGQTAIKTATLINGAAAVALLAFLGHVWDKGLTAVVAKGVTEALLLFVVGVFFSAVGAGGTYLSLILYEIKYIKTGRVIAVITILIILGSLVLFVAGGYEAYLAFVAHFDVISLKRP